LLLYSITSVVVLRLSNPNVAIDAAARAADTVFHSVKDLGTCAIYSMYLSLAVPFASLMALKIYRGLTWLYNFMVLGQVKESRNNRRGGLSDSPSSESFSGFWSEFADGFARRAKGAVLARYLLVVYSLAFLSIPLLSHFKVEPVMPMAIQDVNLAYWSFMMTFVAGAVWAFYVNSVAGNLGVEKFFLKLFYSFFSLSALAAVFSPDRLEYLTFSLPPITLIGTTICMLSLEKQVSMLTHLPVLKRLLLFVAGVAMITVPSAFVTRSPWANNTLHVVYLWSGSAAGLAIWGYLAASHAEVKHRRFASILTFLCFEVAFMSRFVGLGIHLSDFEWAWALALGTGFLAALFWRRSERISFCVITVAWVANELLSQNWFYLLILLQGLAIGNTARERERQLGAKSP